MRKGKLIYLDACATSPPIESCLNEMALIQREYWGNPSSIHICGIKALEKIERCRKTIAFKLNCEMDEIIFTSGATESIHLALLGTCQNMEPGKIVISSVEHPAVYMAAISLVKYGWELVYWPVDNKGLIKLDLMDTIITADTKLVSVIWGQSEIGTIQPIKIVGDYCKSKNIIFHTDATQIIPHGLINRREVPADLISFSAHKLRGPKGIGVLIKNNNSREHLGPIQVGGSQENSLRAGTQSAALIVGLTEAIISIEGYIDLEDYSTCFPASEVSIMTSQLRNKLSNNINLSITGDLEKRLPNHISYIIESNCFISGTEVVRELSKHNICISSGTACNSQRASESSVLEAIGINKEQRKSAIRISLGSWLKSSDLKDVATILEYTIRKLSVKKIY